MGGIVSRKGPGPVQTISAESELDLVQVNPSEFMPADQQLLIEGLLWKLDSGANPDKNKSWVLRKFWLTSGGGLFTYSQQHSTALGRSATHLQVTVVDIPRRDLFAFELKAEQCGMLTDIPSTVLAAQSKEDRDDWISQLKTVAEAEENQTTPLGIFVGLGIQSARSRLCGAKAPLSQLEGAQIMTSEDCIDTLYESQGSESEMSDRISNGSPRSSNASGRTGVSKSSVEHSLRRMSCGASIFLPTEVAFSPQSSLRRDSQADFMERSNTTIVLDWDDTIFPTTWIREDLGLSWRQTLADQAAPSEDRDAAEVLLNKLTDRVASFIRTCSDHATVVIVTLAQRPWVEVVARNFMPDLATLLDELKIEIHYAREHVTQKMKDEYNQKDMRTGDEEAEYWMRAKANAMVSALRRNYCTQDVSWKNLISFGDSEAERAALLTAANEYLGKDIKDKGAKVLRKGLTGEIITTGGHHKKLRAKAVKMLEEPSCEELIAQMRLFKNWVPHLVERDQGLSIELPGIEHDAELCRLNREITGHNNKISWEQLANMDP